ncbi:MAG TPA: LLM class flavin-dependent oxidoreductase [Trebonia sp.]|nr:LLM class flavin-dependent oxidoreductase [Trebonia sp.]
MRKGLEQCAAAFAAGFDSLNFAEHHDSTAQLSPDPITYAGILGQQLPEATISVLGTDLPLHNPVRVAESYAMLDNVLGGRLGAIGLLRGTPNEYLTYGTNPWESRDAFGFSFMPRAKCAENAAVYRQAAAQAGWTPGPDNILYRQFCYVAETDAPRARTSSGTGGPALADGTRRDPVPARHHRRGTIRDHRDRRRAALPARDDRVVARAHGQDGGARPARRDVHAVMKASNSFGII